MCIRDSTLSYSEIKAVSAILNELDGLEGRLTASVIADRIGITRSVIVNALDVYKRQAYKRHKSLLR